MEDRRVADEAFRRELAERTARMEKGLENVRSDIAELKTTLSKAQMSQLDLYYTLFGGPHPDKAGLLEKFRYMATRDRWIIVGLVALVSFGGKLISPLYTRLVSEWAYNSTAEKWMREQKRPKVKVYRVYQKKADPAPDADTPD